eukprot:CAMPEP_0206297420 /NCGR_PEP_ID=MMETSP0106_2-20121207/6163_1 /ASSEMBLY_ACC=CAM_ASM_000206 /TAXON_ID=81532 /ORGANISM="Acanthoeca-like sp., Strain 10tr" /LENGTH=51 /DNA_ID=CAMNT_0053728085 /DNA_START=32 /DNA_END=187 /DNA_ORIENTATION=+
MTAGTVVFGMVCDSDIFAVMPAGGIVGRVSAFLAYSEALPSRVLIRPKGGT